MQKIYMIRKIARLPTVSNSANSKRNMKTMGFLMTLNFVSHCVVSLLSESELVNGIEAECCCRAGFALEKS